MFELSYDLENNINELRRRLHRQGPFNPSRLHGTDVKEVRHALSQFCHFNITQQIFADVMGFQPTIVELWEDGLAEPNTRSSNMIRDIRKHPKRVLLALQGKGYIKERH
ncbi:helix-turn-helix domain-containing protein [Acetilactobacillus jinshanensis]|uniref:Uncharacterized protein n=1 Tax=Acetilactobacillus jinshanensis TaxID=1720083 RepID=A0A4P6ZL84_9LACO|nr:hypothetical protein [Acetilactobacillus jinshanensis]QBP18595.1 hypothetical protein ELX58_05505 [Acetilactobacillus jinshanensis]URL61471.1 hypothetical protein HGK75_05645 [uncultured bacterium]